MLENGLIMKSTMGKTEAGKVASGSRSHEAEGEWRRTLLEVISEIGAADRAAMKAAAARQDSLAKPPGSLGGLELIAIRMAGITGTAIPDGEAKARFPSKGCVLVFCADNGVVAQGVTSAPQSVTRAQTINFTRRLTGVGALSKSFGSELLIVDMGVKDPIPAEFYDALPLRDTHKIVDRRIRPGTWDISQGPAMTEAEALQAMASGVEMARAAADAGFQILGIGEMGIGNTTTSAAVLSAITGAKAGQTCGRGGGVNDTGFQRKKEIVDQIRAELCGASLGTEKSRCLQQTGHPRCVPQAEQSTGVPQAEQSAGVPQADRKSEDEAASRGGNPSGVVRADRFDRIAAILTRCGGFDIAAMTGAFLGAAACRIPVVIDGYISVVAALAAAEIEPAAADYMFASHISEEPGYTLAMERLQNFDPGLKPFLDLDMRLGEGSGCPIAFEVIRGACDVMRNMATFEEAEINDDYLEEVRAGGCF